MFLQPVAPDMASIFERDTTTIGTVIGVLMMAIALFGSTVLGWEWGASGQPIALLVGVIATILAVWVSFRKL